MRAETKKGGLDVGTAPQKGVLGVGTTTKSLGALGVLDTSTTRKKWNLGLIFGVRN